MVDLPKTIKQWQMVQPTAKNKETGEVTPGKLEMAEIPVPELKEGEVLVQIAGCGVCHTDLGYFYDMVPTVSKPPLALGHEIAGTVVAGDPAWIGKEVIIPAVMPCRKCELCKTGRGNRCLAQKMPGNSIGVYGGFASHIPVPTIDLCEVKNRGSYALEQLAVIADAVTTPYQAAKRADLQPGDNVIVIGATGGVGVYMAQTAKALGAKTVIGIARNEEKLKRALDYGCDHVISTVDKTNKDVVGDFKAFCKSKGLSGTGWKIFEVTGSKPGQGLALDLLSFVGKLILVGFGMAKNEYMFSKLMAFDAEVIGTWGCLPEYYPIVLDMVLSKKIVIDPFVEVRPMSTIAATFDEIHKAGSPAKRVVLTPDFK
ncbi:6-hydroxycyclohex-1-ene-1-carbonyl-CoA dehydrogenase [Desulforhabdus sp. TSK]|uniref:6-hydroxycyclohex-1-ene-1-carbonyl-CoA dehydrogenase n=1 Tax=Desulforhabdus sp. TSK TaxID=2925014 RepID=UPI001FC7E026|nr:6-hydroxycyclohex-1-ene-1-carbonyl-CoA dehydrogenase [Desulforhabdus sp. TSK]GKT08548.1 6-hydroxycyclohex-1-ene-1-carbonyl-CoA dehydrogenase [Desulforhabdus sp. TSK]